MEFKLIALEKICFEAEWLRNLLENLPMFAHHPTTMPIHCDCQVATVRAISDIYNKKSIHIMRHRIVK